MPKQKRIIENDLSLVLCESASDKPRHIKGVGITCEQVNKNNRTYPVDVVRKAVEEVRQHLHESAGQGRLLLGELEHPEQKSGIPQIGQTAIKWTDISFDEAAKQVILEGYILPTTAGRDLLALLDNGIPGNLSQRGYGTVEIMENGVQRVTELHITGYDVVLNPSDSTAKITEILESERVKMTYEELSKLIEENRDLFGDLVKGIVIDANTKPEDIKLTESLIRNFLRISEDVNVQQYLDEMRAAKAKIEEQKRQEAIGAVLEEYKSKLSYRPALNEAFVRAVQSMTFGSVDEARKFCEAKIEEYNMIEANERLKEQGIEAQKRQNINEISVRPVFEAYTGMPEYVKPSVLLSESLHARGLGDNWDYSKPKNRVQEYASKFLRAFDETNAMKLIGEYEQWQKLQSLGEAQTTAQLPMPVTTVRTVLAEMFPKSVAFAVFNSGQTNSQSDQIPYETFEMEPNMEVTVPATAINAFVPAWTPAPVGQWKDLPVHNGYQIRNVVIGSLAFSGGFTEYTDYVVDYYNGRVKSLTAGFAGMANTTTLTLKYLAVRKGELQPIERVRMTLNYKPYTCQPNRWALMISEEAMRYSRAQLGYDVRAVAIDQSAKWMARNLDKQLLYFALSNIMAIPSNFVTYSKANPVDSQTNGFTVRVGEARVKLEQRYYDIDQLKLVVDVEMAERMSNSELFGAANSRPDFALSGSNGHVGFWKGIPVFRTTELDSNYAILVHPDLVYYRTWGGVELQGEFPVYASTGDVTRLVAAKQWMLSNYDSMGILRENAGSAVKITN